MDKSRCNGNDGNGQYPWDKQTWWNPTHFAGSSSLMDYSKYSDNFGQNPWKGSNWSNPTHSASRSSPMDVSEYNGNDVRHSWDYSVRLNQNQKNYTSFQANDKPSYNDRKPWRINFPTWSNPTHSAGHSGAMDVSKYNGNDVRQPRDYSDRLKQSQKKYTSFQVDDKPKNNDRKPWSINFWKTTNKSNSKRTPPCGFCKNNKESPECFNNHSTNDKYDRVSCPRLFNYKCPLCGATGYDAHTIVYCPLNVGQ